jgi:D-beta-D-heptose 7-phosphate kinase/D-beta-D-heptose 1-phosphate adenosyltransferase
LTGREGHDATFLDQEYGVGQIMTLETAQAWRRAQRAGQRQVVLTNGFFDLLHVGHARYLQAARAMGDVLVVGVNGDASARAIKPGRPVVPESERAELLAALGCVDVVVVFNEPTAGNLVSALQPDVYVKGGDWGPGKRVPPEAAIVEQFGGRVAYLPYVPEHSTTALIAQIRALES